MPVPILVWVIAAGVASFAAGYFWDDVIKPWAIRAANKIIDLIDQAAEYFSEGVVYLIKEGRKFLKQLKVYTKTKNGTYKSHTETQEIPRSEIPDDILSQLDGKGKQEVGRIQIGNN